MFIGLLHGCEELSQKETGVGSRMRDTETHGDTNIVSQPRHCSGSQDTCILAHIQDSAVKAKTVSFFLFFLSRLNGKVEN